MEFLGPDFQAQAKVTHFSNDELVEMQLGNGSLESKWSQLLLPQGLPVGGKMDRVGSRFGVFINWLPWQKV